MNTRLVAILLLVWLVPFFAVIAPGHQRGAVVVPGTEALTLSALSCGLCDLLAGTDGETPASPVDPAGSCAVCHFNGTLLNPPVFSLPDLKPTRLDLPADRLAVALAPQPAPLPRLSGRAPPTASSA